VVTVHNLAPDGKLSLSTIKGCSFNEEIRRKEMGAGIEQALVTNGGVKVRVED